MLIYIHFMKNVITFRQSQARYLPISFLANWFTAQTVLIFKRNFPSESAFLQVSQNAELLHKWFRRQLFSGMSLNWWMTEEKLY